MLSCRGLLLSLVSGLILSGNLQHFSSSCFIFGNLKHFGKFSSVSTNFT